MAASSTQLGRLHITGRVATGLIGSWLFTWGFVVLGVVLLTAAGMGYGDAQTLMFLLAFIVYLVAMLWSFAAASLARVALLLFGSGALMTGLAWLMSST